LAQLLGLLTLASAVCLAPAGGKPESYGRLVLVPWLGRVLGMGLWLWVWGASMVFPPERIPCPRSEPLLLLAFHDALGMGLLSAFLILLERIYPSRRTA
jgi:hypothetical protein